MSSTAAAAAGIELRNLAKSYSTPSGTIEAVRGIDVSIAPGETVALLGPNSVSRDRLFSFGLNRGILPRAGL